MTFQLPIVGPLERALYLRSVPSFHTFRAQDLVLFAQLMCERWIRRGTVVLGAGQRVRSVGLLVEGRVRRECAGGPGRRLQAPEAVGLLELLANERSRVHYVADTNLLALEIGGAALLDLLEDHFGAFSSLRRALGKQVSALRRELGEVAADPTATEAPPPPTASFGFVERLIWASRSPVLRDFGVSVLADLIRGGTDIRLERNDILWESGGDGQFLTLIVEGTVVGTGADSARRFRAGPGSVLGIEAAFGGTPHPYTASAEAPLRAIRIDTQALLDVAEDHFHVAAQILAHCARSLLRLQKGGAAFREGNARAPDWENVAEDE